MAFLGGGKSFGSGKRGTFSHHEIRPGQYAVRQVGHFLADHYMTGRAQSIAECGDVLTVRIGDNQLNVKRAHGEK